MHAHAPISSTSPGRGTRTRTRRRWCMSPARPRARPGARVSPSRLRPRAHPSPRPGHAGPAELGDPAWTRRGRRGVLPDPGALAILLAAIASGKVVLGLFTVLVFSLGFASVLVLVGIVAARVGQLVLTWLESRWILWLQLGTGLVILAVGVAADGQRGADARGPRLISARSARLPTRRRLQLRRSGSAGWAPRGSRGSPSVAAHARQKLAVEIRVGRLVDRRDVLGDDGHEAVALPLAGRHETLHLDPLVCGEIDRARHDDEERDGPGIRDAVGDGVAEEGELVRRERVAPGRHAGHAHAPSDPAPRRPVGGERGARPCRRAAARRGWRPRRSISPGRPSRRTGGGGSPARRRALLSRARGGSRQARGRRGPGRAGRSGPARSARLHARRRRPRPGGGGRRGPNAGPRPGSPASPSLPATLRWPHSGDRGRASCTSPSGPSRGASRSAGRRRGDRLPGRAAPDRRSWRRDQRVDEDALGEDRHVGDPRDEGDDPRRERAEQEEAVPQVDDLADRHEGENRPQAEGRREGAGDERVRLGADRERASRRASGRRPRRRVRSRGRAGLPAARTSG